DARDPSGGEVVELPALDAVDALVRADPEMAARVLLDREHAVAVEAVVRLVADEPAVLEAAQPLAVGADPERAFAVLVDRAHVVADEPVLRRVVGDPAVVVARQPAEAAEPQAAFTVFVHEG